MPFWAKAHAPLSHRGGILCRQSDYGKGIPPTLGLRGGAVCFFAPEELSDHHLENQRETGALLTDAVSLILPGVEAIHITREVFDGGGIDVSSMDGTDT